MFRAEDAMAASNAANVLQLLQPAQRRMALALLGMMMVGTVLETLGVALVTPVLALMSRVGPAGGTSRLEQLLPPSLHLTRGQLLGAAVTALVAVYAIKALYLGFLAWRQSRFVFDLQLSLSQRLFSGYLHQPYAFHLQRNSAQMIRNVVSETSQFSHLAVIPGITLLSEALVLAGIAALLLVMEPIGASIVILTISLAGALFHRLTRMRLLRWGQAREHHEGMRLQHLQQGLGGVKDVKLLGRESQFLATYATHDKGVARVQERQLTLQALPRLWLELLGVVGLAALVFTLLLQSRPLDTMVPTLGLFAAAAFRLMPSVTKVLTAIQSLRFADPVIRTLAAELGQLQSSPAVQRSGDFPLRRSLRLDNVSYAYPGTADAALKDVNLTIRQGSSVGFVGGSGAGKTTLIDLVLGLLSPTSGAVRVDDADIRQNLRGWQDQIGYVPQSIYLTDDTIRCNIAFGVDPRQIDDHAVWRALRAAQLEEFVSALPDGLDTFVGERGVRISGGQRQRIGIARALYNDPDVLVLDEATSALDTATEQDVMGAVKALRGMKTILIVAHRISTVEHCDVVVRLERGSVVEAGDAKAVLAHCDVDDRAVETLVRSS
jgi:ABC-type multidrug transport system fused ATPase/permease subunit